MFDVNPLTIFFGTALVAVLGWTYGRDKAHANCPVSRDVLTDAEHEEKCGPIKQRLAAGDDRLARMDAKIDRILDEQRKAVTTETLVELITMAKSGKL